MSKNVLLIDDDIAIRKAFRLAFEGSEYGLDTAENGYIGVEKVENGNFDLIFLDLKMPGINGVETLQRIRAFNKDVTVYILTAFHKEFFVELEIARENGIDFELINKPITNDQLLMVTRAILR